MDENQDQVCFFVWLVFRFLIVFNPWYRQVLASLGTYIYFPGLWPIIGKLRKPQGFFQALPSLRAMPSQGIPNHNQIITYHFPLFYICNSTFNSWIWRKGPYQLWSPVKTGVWWEKAALEGSAQKTPTELKQFRKAHAPLPDTWVLKDLRNSLRGFTVWWNNESAFIVSYEGAENDSQS